MANVGVLGALLDRDAAVFSDRLNHASLIDAARLSRAAVRVYGHGDVADLDAQLAAESAGRRLVITDGVFSMDGDLAPLPALAWLARRRDAWLMVDDAHGFGVLGPAGAGSVAQAGLGIEDVPVLMGTLGKALGTSGAFVAGSEALIEALANGARRWGVGAGASHLLAGHTAAHHALEQELADAVGRPRALLFSTGYMANLGVLAALLDRHAAVFSDRLNHAKYSSGDIFINSFISKAR